MALRRATGGGGLLPKGGRARMARRASEVVDDAFRAEAPISAKRMDRYMTAGRVDRALNIVPKRDAQQAATRPTRTNASPISVVDNEFDAPVRAAPKAAASAPSVRPPAGLTASQAAPILRTFLAEKGMRAPRASRWRAMLAEIDEMHGAGTASKIIDDMNRMPNGASSMHYRK